MFRVSSLAAWVFGALAVTSGVAAAVATDWWIPSAAPVAPEPALRLDQVVAEPERFAGRRVVARGRYDQTHTVFVLRQTFAHRRGARVYTPLQIAEGGKDLVLLVDRGWIPSDEVASFADRDAAEEERVLYGSLLPRDFGSTPRHGVEELVPKRRALRPVALQRELPYPLLPMILVREAGSGVELPLAAVAAPPPQRRVPVFLWALALGFAAAGAGVFFRFRRA